jgi:hypothetical protein
MVPILEGQAVMSKTGLTVFVRFPSESERRVLYATKVTQTSGADKDLGFEVGQELLIYFDRGRQFVQQPAKVEALLESESGDVVVLKTVGEPISAEGRQCYRVSTALSNLTVTFGGLDGCLLRDVSVSGFAVISSGQHKTGQVVEAELVFEGKRYTGQASIQSVTPMPDGKTRYGVNCIKGPVTPDSLLKGVQQVSMSVQRQQLSRLAGGA